MAKPRQNASGEFAFARSVRFNIARSRENSAKGADLPHFLGIVFHPTSLATIFVSYLFPSPVDENTLTRGCSAAITLQPQTTHALAMVQNFLLNRLERLRDIQGSPALSLFIPTEPLAKSESKYQFPMEEIAQVIRNAVAAAGKEEALAEQFIRQTEELLGGVSNKYLLLSIGIFLGPGHSELLYLPVSQPLEARLDDTFAVDRLIYPLNRHNQYIALVLSKKNTRVFQGFNRLMVEASIDEMPRGLEKDKSGFSGTSFDKKHGGGSLAATVKKTEVERRLKKYILQMNEVVEALLKQLGIPLVILGNEQFLAGYRKFGTGIQEVTALINGSYDYSSSIDIAEVVAPVLEQKQTVEVQYIGYELEVAAERGLTAAGIEQVHAAAEKALVNKLLVEKNYHPAASEVAQAVEPLGKLNDNPYPDAVDLIIRQVRQNSGPVLYLQEDALKKYDRILAILEEEEEDYPL